MQEQNNHTDVLIVGAGLSGIGAAHYLQTECPDHTYNILEMRSSIGGTWDLFRYPGIRSDSDMYTLGYAFRPWKEQKAIADGPSILKYIRDTAEEEGIADNIKYNHKVVRVNWSSEEIKWYVEVEQTQTGEKLSLSCNFLMMCVGYYNYESGYTPAFEGRDRFQGRVVHPQRWTEDIDYENKKVIVIGSGATAVTLVPELAKKATSVVMLQRSPTYVVSRPAIDPVANWIRKTLPTKLTYHIVRWKNVLMGLLFYKLARSRPDLVKNSIAKGIEQELGTDYDVKTHFSPKYNPWDQRLCLVPDSDLFKSIKSGRTEVVTDHIETFTEKGILLKSGKELEADLIVTATGLRMEMMSGQELCMDGKPVNSSEKFVYRGMLLSDVPNLAFAIGYTNASWTLKSDLVCQYFCRLLNHMKKTGKKQFVTRMTDPSVQAEPLMDFNSGYVLRAVKALPKQGSKRPWKLHQNYPLDILNFKYSSLKDGALEFR